MDVPGVAASPTLVAISSRWVASLTPAMWRCGIFDTARTWHCSWGMPGAAAQRRCRLAGSDPGSGCSPAERYAALAPAASSQSRTARRGTLQITPDSMSVLNSTQSLICMPVPILATCSTHCNHWDNRALQVFASIKSSACAQSLHEGHEVMQQMRLQLAT